MKSLVFVALLLLSAQCTSTEEVFLSHLRETDFGQTILETVQLELQQGGSVERILTLLRQLRADLINEQRDADAKNRNDNSICEIKIGETVADLTRAKEQKADDERQLPLLREEQTDKQRQADDKKDQEQRNLDKIHVLTEERAESRHEYEERRDELTALIATLQEGKRIIAQLKSGSSFLQMTSPVLAELAKHQAKFAKNHPKQRGFHGMVSLLLQITQDPGIQANQGGVAKILAVIDDLVESIYDVQRQELLAENDRQQDYEIKKARLQLEITRLEGTIAELNAKVLLIDQKILEINNDVATNTQVIENKTSENNNWTKTCADQERTYEVRTENRSESLTVLDQVIQIFEIKFDVAKSFVQTIQLH